MTQGHDAETLISYWLDKADRSIASAQLDLDHGHLDFAVSRLYYGCFYALTAVITRDRKKVGKKHSAIRSALHRAYVRTGLMPQDYGRLFDRLFISRQRSDYEPWAQFETSVVTTRLHEAKQFVAWCRHYAQQLKSEQSDQE